MSPALSPSTSPIARTIPSLPVIDDWNNRLPPTFSQLENRVSYLTTESNRILEMHPNGTRGVEKHTEYCMLTIFVVAINAKLGAGWGQDKGKSTWDLPIGGQLNSQHVIMGNKTGLFLCMDDHSIPYQTFYKNDSKFSEHCYFNHEQTDHRESYYRTVNGTKRWYLGINKDGSIRCGNVTRHSQRGARFIKQSIPHEHEPPEPYKPFNKPCCPKDRCGRHRGRHNHKHNKQESETPKRRKCNTNKRWCKKRRRQFFKLSLKELKRYYNRCIKEKKRKIRHCDDR